MDTYQSEEQDAVQKAREEGIDITLLYENLRRRPTERVENFKRWLSFVGGLKKARKNGSLNVRYR